MALNYEKLDIVCTNCGTPAEYKDGGYHCYHCGGGFGFSLVEDGEAVKVVGMMT